jgi:cyclophilin family peptidyl-prolyl cis-trans isomerase
MKHRRILRIVLFFGTLVFSASAAPVIDPIPSASIPAGKTLILPVTASSPNGRPLTFTATSSTNRITTEIHTNNPFWKMSVVQAAAGNPPGSFPTPFRGGVVTVTNIGDLTFMLFRDLAPHTVDVIQGLTAGGLYTSNTIFHRVIAGFMNQGGDPMTNGTGGPVFRYNDEFNPKAIFSGNGQLALANSGKDTDGSQFFITVAPFRSGDFGYTIFGQLLRGFNVLSNINNTATGANNRPLADVIITRASFVPDNFDTVLTLTGTNAVGVVGTISVVADDGASGSATNYFTATTVTDTQNDPPFLYPNTVTNLVAPVNGRLTNIVTALDLEGDLTYWLPQFTDQASYLNASNSTYGFVNGQLQLIIVPDTNYVGPIGFVVYVGPNSSLTTYDKQIYTFAFGDTVISAIPTNFTATALMPFTNLLLATFTNGVPNSATNNFTAFINWGDNSTNGGLIVTNLAGWKEVRGSHTYTNAGNYPVYLTLQSIYGASATVVCTGSVPPVVSLMRIGTNNVVSWPAWATDYQLQSATNVAGPNWPAVTNFFVLTGYDSVVTNSTTNGAFFFRLKK